MSIPNYRCLTPHLVLQDMASFRNMLVHRYETIDDELVFGIFKKRLDDFELFITLVARWAESQKE